MTWDLCPFAYSALLGSLPGSRATMASNAAADRGPMPLSQAKIGTPETPRLLGLGPGRLPAAHVAGEAGLAPLSREPQTRPRRDLAVIRASASPGAVRGGAAKARPGEAPLSGGRG